MYEIHQSKTFVKWLTKLRSIELRDSITVRILRMHEGHLGDCKSVGSGLYEARMHAAGGIRIYFMRQGNTIIVLLVGGDKSSQERDIVQARAMAKSWED
jgi:putative addiction module killer protein